MTAFPCCTCPEPPGYDPEVDNPLKKYRNKCGCPTATFSCESLEKDAELCGFDEYSGFESAPPKRYIDRRYRYYLYIKKSWVCCSGTPGLVEEKTLTSERIRDWTNSLPDCIESEDLTQEVSFYKKNYDCNGDLTSEGVAGFSAAPEFMVAVSATKEENVGSRVDATFSPTGDCAGETRGTTDWGEERVLLNEDTEEAALARATETDGTSCTSIYELRTTSFSLTVRTVKFSLELTNLCYGRAYEGCVRIRKRKAFSGTIPSGEVIEWEDVEPFTFGPITPSAANTTDGVTTTAEITDQDLVGGTEDAIGWEYEIVSAHVWPVSAGCDCPTELGYTDPE